VKIHHSGNPENGYKQAWSLLLEARIIKTLHAKNYEYWFWFLQVIEN